MSSSQSSKSAGAIGASGGNTKTPSAKRVNPSKRWCFTLNNYKEEDIKDIIDVCGAVGAKFVFQEEVGEQGTEHLQGYICFKTRKRPIGMFKNNKIHFEKCKGNEEQNFEYCTKSDTRKEGTTPYMCGFKIKEVYKVEIDELYEWEEELIDKIKNYKEDRKIIWRWETQGNTGKTTFLKYLFTNQDELGIDGMVVLSGKASDMKNGIIKFQEVNESLPSLVVVNIPRSTNLEYISYTGLEEIKDMFFFSGKYEGGMVCGKKPCMIIMSNEEPNYDELSMDRWDVKEI